MPRSKCNLVQPKPRVSEQPARKNRSKCNLVQPKPEQEIPEETVRKPSACPGYCERAEFFVSMALRRKRLEEATAEFWRLFHAHNHKYLFALLAQNLEQEQSQGCLVTKPDDLAAPITRLLQMADEGQTFELRVVEVGT